MKSLTLKDELPRSVSAQYATGDRWRNNFKKTEEMGPKQKQYPVVDVTGDTSKARCCKEHYCIGTWNVTSMNQGKLEVVKAEEPEIKLLTSTGSLKKQESSRKTSISALLTIPNPLTVWITINCGKFWKRWEYQTTWPASWETCMQVRKHQLELDMEQQTGSK